MPRNILIWDNFLESRDDIDVYFREPAVVIVCPRCDLRHLQSITYSAHPGVYVLLGDDRRYVGKSTNVLSRLSTHNSTKEFWDTAVILVREDGFLDQAQIQYLEGELIAMFAKHGVDLENDRSVSRSWIPELQKARAITTLEAGLKVITEVSDLDLLNSRSASIFPAIPELCPTPADDRCEQSANTSATEKRTYTSPPEVEVVIADDNGVVISGNSARSVYIDYLRTIATPENISALLAWSVQRGNAYFTPPEQGLSSRKECILLTPEIVVKLYLSRSAIQRMLKNVGQCVGTGAVMTITPVDCPPTPE